MQNSINQPIGRYYLLDQNSRMGVQTRQPGD